MNEDQPIISESDVLDAALANLDAVADGLLRSRHAHNPKGLNLWLTRVEREVRETTAQLRSLRPTDPVQAAIASRLERMAQGAFG